MSEADRLYNVNKPKLHTSSFATAVGISMLLLLGYVLGYVVFFLLSGDGGETGGFWAVWGPPLVVGVGVSLIACIPMRFMSKPILVAMGMALLAAYYAVIMIALLTTAGTTDPWTAAYVLTLFCLPCIIPGNVFAWIAWWRFRDLGEEDAR
jgi:hypothetical protein